MRPGVAVTLAGKPVTKSALRSDAAGATPDVLALGALTLQIIDRGGRLGVRLKDMKSPARDKFKGLGTSRSIRAFGSSRSSCRIRSRCQ